VSLDPDNDLAIIFGGSGQGEAMVANTYKGVRATVYYGNETEIIKLSKEHNNANVLSIGARFVSKDILEEIIRLWLMSEFTQDERHERRIKKIDAIDQSNAPTPFLKSLLNKL